MGKISEIILHIGLEKTGSTSIQMFIDDHQTLLRDQGVIASGCLGWQNHKLLAAYAMADGSRDVAVTSAGIDGPDSHRAFRARTRGQVLAEIARTDAQRYLISSEDLSRLTSVDDVRRVHDLMSEICDRIRVIVFLRRQDLLAVSRYYSYLINGWLPPAVFPAFEQARYYDYSGLIDTWAEVFGAGAIRIVHYPEVPAAQGFDAIGAFCGAAGIALPADWQPPARRENVSLDHISQAILEAMNRHSGVLKDNASGKRLLKLLQVADGGVPGQFVSAAQARDFCETFALGNARLARRFGLPSPLFGDDFSMYPDTPPRPADLAQDALVRMVGIVANLLQGAGARPS